MTTSSSPPQRGLDAGPIIYSLLSGHPASAICESHIRDRSGWFTTAATLLEVNAVLRKVYGVDPRLAAGKLAQFAIGPIVINDQRSTIRHLAATLLKDIGPVAKTAVPALKRLLKDPEAQVRESAAEALASMGEALLAIPTLAECLQDPSFLVRLDAIWVLREIGPDASAAIPALLSLLKDSCVSVDSALALAKLGEAKTAVLFLMELLNDVDEYNRWRAASALGNIGAEAMTAIPALAGLLKDQAWLVRQCAAEALAKLGETVTALPILAELLKNRDGAVRESAACAIGNVGPEANAAIPAPAEVFADNDWEVRCTAAGAMGKMGPEAQSFIPALMVLLNDKHWQVRKATGEALEKIQKQRRWE